MTYFILVKCSTVNKKVAKEFQVKTQKRESISIASSF